MSGVGVGDDICSFGVKDSVGDDDVITWVGALLEEMVVVVVVVVVVERGT